MNKTPKWWDNTKGLPPGWTHLSLSGEPCGSQGEFPMESQQDDPQSGLWGYRSNFGEMVNWLSLLVGVGQSSCCHPQPS